jgi:hypothetical protein
MNSMHTFTPCRLTVRLPGSCSALQRIGGHVARSLFVGSVVAASCLVGSAALAEQGMLQTIRQDVRGDGAPSSSPPSDNAPDDRSDECCEPGAWMDNSNASGCSSSSSGCNRGESTAMAFWIVPTAVIFSPIWVPHAMLGDDFRDCGGFSRFPYADDSGYIDTSRSGGKTKPLAVRLDLGYAETFNRLDSIDGHLLLETASRFGLAASVHHLEERLSGGGRDQLDIGDCNFVYRFAQNNWAEFRAGLGLNWMNDTEGTDVGFNFIYAADLYPRKPWVVSAEIDAGTLGCTGLFRFRTTAGVVFHGIETYTGYEYTDIGRTHWNSLIAGVRLWF